MMQIIDERYVQAIIDLPDGARRITEWVHGLIGERDTADAVAKACVDQIAPLKRQCADVRSALNHEIQVRRDQRIELQAEIDAAYAELDAWRRGEKP